METVTNTDDVLGNRRPVGDWQAKINDLFSSHLLARDNTTSGSEPVAELLSLLEQNMSAVNQLKSLREEISLYALPPALIDRVSHCVERLSSGNTQSYAVAKELSRSTGTGSQVNSASRSDANISSTALVRLQESYDKKKAELEIALKQLELFDAKSCAMERSERLQNWEKLFLGMTRSLGHGRRWKFLIQPLKNKVKEGSLAVRKYLSDMDKTQDLDHSQLQSSGAWSNNRSSKTKTRLIRTTVQIQGEFNEEKGENFIREKPSLRTQINKSLQLPVETLTHVSSGSLSPPQRRATVMRDDETWTGEPEYDIFLCVRVFTPVSARLDGPPSGTSLHCSLRYGWQKIVTDRLNEEAENRVEMIDQRRAVTGYRSLIGSRATNGVNNESSGTSAQQGTTSPKYDDCVFAVSDTVKPKSNDHLTIEVYCGIDVVAATAIVDAQDIASLEPTTFFIAPPKGDEPLKDESVLLRYWLKENSKLTNSGRKVKHGLGTGFLEPFDVTDEMQFVHPVNIPLFEADGAAGRAIGLRKAWGQIPLAICWVKRERPKFYHRSTDCQSLDAHVASTRRQRMIDRSVSPIQHSNEQQIALIKTYDEQIKHLRTDYEAKLAELRKSIVEMEETNSDMLRLVQMTADHSVQSTSDLGVREQKPALGSSSASIIADRKRSSTMSATRAAAYGSSPTLTRSRTETGTTMTGNDSKTRATPSSNWDRNIPQDFYARMRHFDDRMQSRRQELSSQVCAETESRLEKGLAGQFKLDIGSSDSMTKLDAAGNDPSTLATICGDISLPAVFMPTKQRDLTMYNPRANRYFHPNGLNGVRITQPPSILDLRVTLPENLSVLNIFEVSQNFQPVKSIGSDWLIGSLPFQQDQQSQPNGGDGTSDGIAVQASSVIIPSAKVTTSNRIPSVR